MNTPFSFHHASGLEITSGLKRTDAASVIGSALRDMKTGYVWIDLPESTLAGWQVRSSVCFFGEDVHSITIAISDTERYGGGWDEWSEEKENLRAEDTNQLLLSLGYPNGSFDWVDVWTGFDRKGGSGHGIIMRWTPIFGQRSL